MFQLGRSLFNPDVFEVLRIDRPDDTTVVITFPTISDMGNFNYVTYKWCKPEEIEALWEYYAKR